MLRNAVQSMGVCVRGVCMQPARMWRRPVHTSVTQSREVTDNVGESSVIEDGMQTHRVERLEKTLNQVVLLGRVGGNPEKRGTEERPVVTFSLATHTNYRRDEDLIQQTDWHRIAVFKPYLRESVYRYLGRGQRVMVQGRIGYLERRDPESNQLLMKTATIVADDVIFFNKSSSDY